jgi:hypothetical protein
MCQLFLDTISPATLLFVCHERKKVCITSEGAASREEGGPLGAGIQGTGFKPP